jgi:murein L,D-transpeptidase YafK
VLRLTLTAAVIVRFAVHIFTFVPTADAMARDGGSPWFEFWSDLKRAYDAFDASRQLPAVAIHGGRYVVGGP